MSEPFMAVPQDAAPTEAGNVEYDAADGGTSGARSAAARLARIHLRTGLHGLARAELETLAGQGGLDAEALVDLAEVRWRTGDITGAGEAALACRGAGVDETIVLLVLAESAAAMGRTGDARELAARVLAREPYRIDAIFAGVPRSPVWPAPTPPALPAPSEPISTQYSTGSASIASRQASIPGPEVPTAGDLAPRAPADVGGRSALPDELAEVQQSIARRETAGIGVRLSIVLRSHAALAPAVLAAAEDALRASPEPSDAAAIHLVRSDAYRLMGRETLSRQAVQQAHGALRAPRVPQDQKEQQ
jgi:hypothetical protein